MTPEQQTNLRQWITALRSGEYKQGWLYLKSDEGYCCLGVASVIDPDVILTPKDEVWEFMYNNDDLWEQQEPSEDWFLRRFGLPVEQMETLVVMNDAEKKSFLEIADHLETFLHDPVSEAQ